MPRGRPPIEDGTRGRFMSFVISPSQEEHLRQYAAKADRPMSWIIRTALKQYLERVEKTGGESSDGA